MTARKGYRKWVKKRDAAASEAARQKRHADRMAWYQSVDRHGERDDAKLARISVAETLAAVYRRMKNHVGNGWRRFFCGQFAVSNHAARCRGLL